MTKTARGEAMQLLDVLHEHQEAVLTIDVLAEYIKPAVPLLSMSERQKIVWHWASGNGHVLPHHAEATQQAEANAISAIYDALRATFATWCYDDGSVELSVGDEPQVVRVLLEFLREHGFTIIAVGKTNE